MYDYSKFIGKPYDKKNFNCWHLVKEVLKDMLNIKLPEAPEIDNIKPLFRLRDKTECPEIGDIVLMYLPEPNHVGVYVGGNKVLHNHDHSQGVITSHLRACERTFLKVEVYAINNYSS